MAAAKLLLAMIQPSLLLGSAPSSASALDG